MKEYIEPCILPEKKQTLFRKAAKFLPGFLTRFLERKAQEYFTLKKQGHWREFKTGSVIDLGCGFGQFMEFAPSNISVTGINLNDEEIKVARKKGLKVVKADCRKLPFKPKSIDGVNCSHLIEHIDDPTTLLREAHRVLKKGGTIVVRTPDFLRYFDNFYDDPSHINPFTAKKLEKVLTYSGFLDISVKSGDYTSNWLMPLTIFPSIRIWIEDKLSKYSSHELLGIARKR